MSQLASLRFTTSELAEAIGTEFGNLKSWTDRGILDPVKPNGTSSGKGWPRHYDLAGAYKAGIIAALSEFRIGSKQAGTIAAAFTDKGSAGRKRGELFPDGKTWIVQTARETRVQNTAPGDSIPELLDDTRNGRLTTAAIVLDISRLIKTLDEKLKISQFKEVEDVSTYTIPGLPGKIEFKTTE